MENDMKKGIKKMLSVMLFALAAFILIQESICLFQVFTSEYKSGVVVSGDAVKEYEKEKGKYTAHTYASLVKVETDGKTIYAVARRTNRHFMPQVGESVSVIKRIDGTIFVGHFEDDLLKLILWLIPTLWVIYGLMSYFTGDKEAKYRIDSFMAKCFFNTIFMPLALMGIVSTMQVLCTSEYYKGEILEADEPYEVDSYRRTKNSGYQLVIKYYQDLQVDVNGEAIKVIVKIGNSEEKALKSGDLLEVYKKYDGIYEAGSRWTILKDLGLYLGFFLAFGAWGVRSARIVWKGEESHGKTGKR